MRYAYATDGLAHHRLDDALLLLADSGYDGVALTLGAQHLDPCADDALQQAERVRERCDALGLGVVVGTGAGSLRDPRDGHEPTLVAATADGRARRLDLLRRCADVADVLQAEALSLWTGVQPPGVGRAQAWRWVREGVMALVDSHGGRSFALAVEPVPGMLIDDCEDWQRLHASVPSVRLALDTGHCVVSGPYAPDQAVRVFAPHLGTVAVGGMRRGVHEHLPLDEGDVDVPAVLQALSEVGWDGLVTLELSRDSSRAHQLVPASLALLRRLQP